MPRRFAVSDIHGHLAPLQDTLRDAGLTDPSDSWAGGNDELWFLGDFVDRGPDGVAVIDFIRRLQDEADGTVHALVGNHEVLALGKRDFGDEEVPADHAVIPARRSFHRSWTINGGQTRDQSLLTDEHVEWLRHLPFVARAGEDLLMHSDTLSYLAWGADIDAVNATGRNMLRSAEIATRFRLWRDMTDRYAFNGDKGVDAAQRMLTQLGGRRIVHGHSIVATLIDVDFAQVREPYRYADGLALAIDGGIYEGGPCLLVRLDGED